MEESILNSIKTVLGLDATFTAFDEDILMHINSVFSDLYQLGVGPAEGFFISDESTEWSEYFTDGVTDYWMNSVRSYIFLRVQLMFDVSSMTSYVIQAKERQIAQFEWRLNVAREEALYPPETV